MTQSSDTPFGESYHPRESTESGQGVASKDRLREQGRKVADDVRELGEIAKETAEERWEELRRRGAKLRDEGRRSFDDYEERLLAYVRQNPLKASLYAAGIGALLGLMIRR